MPFHSRVQTRFLVRRFRSQRVPTIERLEDRHLFAADVFGVHHNSTMATDVTMDGATTEDDFMAVIQALEVGVSLEPAAVNSMSTQGLRLDVTNDGQLTPLDAATIVGAFSEAEHRLALNSFYRELIEFVVTIRDLDAFHFEAYKRHFKVNRKCLVGNGEFSIDVRGGSCCGSGNFYSRSNERISRFIVDNGSGYRTSLCLNFKRQEGKSDNGHCKEF